MLKPGIWVRSLMIFRLLAAKRFSNWPWTRESMDGFQNTIENPVQESDCWCPASRPATPFSSNPTKMSSSTWIILNHHLGSNKYNKSLGGFPSKSFKILEKITSRFIIFPICRRTRGQGLPASYVIRRIIRVENSRCLSCLGFPPGFWLGGMTDLMGFYVIHMGLDLKMLG